MLALRRGTVMAAGDPGGPMQELDVRLGGERRPALADVALVGACREGDDVVVNVAAVDLKLGSGGFDIVHVNLTRGLEGTGGGSLTRDPVGVRCAEQLRGGRLQLPFTLPRTA